jgi:hypothetical protein
MKRFGSATWSGGLREGNGPVSTESRPMVARTLNLNELSYPASQWHLTPDCRRAAAVGAKRPLASG